MRNPAGRLGEEQALLGYHFRHAALATVARQGLEVTRAIVAEERKMEPVLTVRFAVAAAGIAAEPRQDRHDVLSETPGPMIARVDGHSG